MPPLINYILRACLLLYALFALIGVLRREVGAWKELACVLAAFVILRWTTGFPAVIQSFSGVTPFVSVIIMFGFVLLGTIANYFFELRGRFSWESFVKPILVSPIVLLPLVGTVATRPEVQPIELISFAILAFQNGFFWRSVFRRASSHSK